MVELGKKYRDKITGFEGVAIARTTYLNGCVRVSLKPTTLAAGKTIDEEWFDEQQLIDNSPSAAGGPRPAAQRASDAPRF